MTLKCNNHDKEASNQKETLEATKILIITF